jgi:hypothetical protein
LVDGVDATPSSSVGPLSTEIIVLDDAPMFLEDGSLLVEDDAVVSSLAELPPIYSEVDSVDSGVDAAVDSGWDDAPSLGDDAVIEVGDEVVFDS